ncbi:MAG: hypothetical protein ACMVP2_18150 [Imperialibacter sp.]|uniref:hypothetical protein n=1 Tax=Imperialibacter sp. TaxID=2038411 RepID=UPI003A8C7340
MGSKEAEQLVKGFEEGTWPSSGWTHFAHFVMALWYTYHHPIAEARKLIKEGIKKYNEAVGGKNTEDSGYHETITELYIQIIIGYLSSLTGEYDFDVLLSNLEAQPFIQKDFPFRFYTKKLLMSREARVGWVEPDVRPITLFDTEGKILNAAS